MKLPILFEDKYLIVIDKPAGLLVHGSTTVDDSATVASLLATKITDVDAHRPGIVHRLDKYTSGVLLVAKDSKTRQLLQSQFRSRNIKKKYIAAVKGVPDLLKARLDLPIGRHPKNPLRKTVRPNGKPAITTYQVVDSKASTSLLHVWPLTGRTHQIRVHLSYIGYPILGDAIYGVAYPGLDRHFLHATEITFTHPYSKASTTFSSDLPDQLKQVWYNI